VGLRPPAAYQGYRDQHPRFQRRWLQRRRVARRLGQRGDLADERTTVTNPNTPFVGTAGSQWAVVGQRDFNGDGFADLLWRDTGGDVMIWEMTGTTLLNRNSSFVAAVPTDWSIVGTGNFNGDAWPTSCGRTPRATWRSGK
jgi:hypothetical protein